MTLPPRLTPAQREALRGHYLATCALQSDRRWRWQCSCREDGGVEKDRREAHRLFAQHLTAVKITTEQ